jgi:hypothetical protein
MWLLTVFRVIFCNAVFRLTGLRSAGRVVVRSLGSSNESVRTIAGMFLVKAGRKSEPLLVEAVRRRENLSLVLTILSDVGGRASEAEIRELSHDHDPQVARAAVDALRFLH